ncbi:unnamed protein product, partial [Oppiella nova]
LTSANGDSIEKRHLFPSPLDLLDGALKPIQSILHPGAGQAGGNRPAVINVEIEQLLRDDSRLQLAADFNNTLKTLNIDGSKFFAVDPTQPGHREIHLAFTPYVKTALSVDKHSTCDGNAGITALYLNTTYATDMACSGYQYKQFPFEYTIDVNGQPEVLPLAAMNQAMASVNGHTEEVHLATISGGRCKGDFLYVQTVFLKCHTEEVHLATISGGRCKGDFLYVQTVFQSPNPLQCVDHSVNKLSVIQMVATITGTNCNTECSLDRPGTVTLNYQRDDLNDQILAFEIRGVNVERVDYNQYVPNAKVLLETLMSDIEGAPHKDSNDLTDYTRLNFPNIKDQDVFMTVNMWCMFTFLLDDFLESQTTKLEYWVSKWEQNITDGHSSGTDFLDIFFNNLRAKMNKVKTGDHMYTLDEYDALS